MSFYNIVNGVTLSTFFILPMLGRHPNEYPRFRNCFTSDEEHPEYDEYIHVYTRVGGGNRKTYKKEIAELRSMEGYVADYDDSFDETFATFVFKIPESRKADFELIKNNKLKDISPEYREQIYKIYPLLKEEFGQIFFTE